MIWPVIPQHVEPWLYYACVAGAVFIVGMSKAGFGGAAGIAAIPVMGSVMPAEHMLGMMLPLLISADILSNLHHLKNYEWRLLKPLLAGAAGGVILGSIGFWMVRDFHPESLKNGLAILIGGICLLFVGLQLWGLSGRRVPEIPRTTSCSVGVGVVSGFVSTLSHSAGPIATLYLLPEKLDKGRFVGTILLMFLLVNISKVPTFVALEYINEGTLRDSLWFIPLVPVSTLLGAWLHKRVPEKPFVMIMYATAAVTAAYMIWKSLKSM